MFGPIKAVQRGGRGTSSPQSNGRVCPFSGRDVDGDLVFVYFNSFPTAEDLFVGVGHAVLEGEMHTSESF
jgi:hypothetical protein